MTAYPETYRQGDVIGRNLVTTPGFPAGNTARGLWSSGAAADREGTLYGAGLGNFLETRIVLDGLTVAGNAGQLVVVSVDALSTLNNNMRFWVDGVGVGSPYARGKSQAFTGIDYQTHTAAFPLPADGFRGATGNSITPDTYELVVVTSANGMTRVSHAWADLEGGYPDGYIDGDTPDDALASYSWGGLPFASGTVAVALTSTAVPDPAPTEPAPTEPAPTEPAPTEPAPTEPDPTEPAPTEPAPTEPDPDEVDALVAVLAPRVAAFVGRPGHAATEAQASAALPVILEFVRGYTRGRGWVGYLPPFPLRSVLVSATARLVTNPEQVRDYSIADYSESPAVLNGYTLAELGVLHRYRRIVA